jgi:serine/threonine-protein kinase
MTGGGSASDPALKPVPKELGAYEIIAEIARGGMGSVYLARRAGEGGFQRLFAVKAMHPHLAEDSAFVEMLKDEARIAARLHHQNVVPVLDLGTQDHIPYVVMEYVDGCAMSALMARNREHRPPELLVSILVDALEGLHAAHTLTDDDGNPLHLVHRDVTPQNILIGVDGSAKITDFGIAKAEARITTTRPGVFKGKFAYMAPEQLVGDGENIDHRADIFAAGAVLWTALTGQRLFRGDTDGATLHNVMHKQVVAPSTIGLNPPVELDAVCLRALERDPDKRFPTAREMADALRAAMPKIGPRTKVAEWVTTSFRAEIDSRRAAIRAVAHEPRRSSSSSLRVPSLPVLAGPPSVAGETGSLRAITSHDGTQPSIQPQTRSTLAPHAEATDAAAERLSKQRVTWVIAAAVPLLLLFGLVFVFVLMPKSWGRRDPTPLIPPAAPPPAESEKAPAKPEVTAEPETPATDVGDIESLPKEKKIQSRPIGKLPSTKVEPTPKASASPATTKPTPPSTTKPSSTKPEVQFEKNPYLKKE